MEPPKVRTSALPKKEIKGGCRDGGLGKECLPIVCRGMFDPSTAKRKRKKLKQSTDRLKENNFESHV